VLYHDEVNDDYSEKKIARGVHHRQNAKKTAFLDGYAAQHIFCITHRLLRQAMCKVEIAASLPLVRRYQ